MTMQQSFRSLRILAAVGAAALASACDADDSASPTGSDTRPESNAATAATAAAAAALAFRSVSAGMFGFTCGVTTADRAYCWGYNGGDIGVGVLGDGTTTFRKVPSAVVGGPRFREVSVGWQHTCGITTGDRAFCWGINTE